MSLDIMLFAGFSAYVLYVLYRLRGCDEDHPCDPRLDPGIRAATVLLVVFVVALAVIPIILDLYELLQLLLRA